MRAYLDGLIVDVTRLLVKQTNHLAAFLASFLRGDIAQLPPVGDKPLCHSIPRTDKQIQGVVMYYEFNTSPIYTTEKNGSGHIGKWSGPIFFNRLHGKQSR